MAKNFAHRGFSGKYPENTLLAFSKAIEAGCDGIEMDVQFTKDKELVVIHDEKVDRTCNGTGLVSEYTLEELKKLDASYIYRDQYEKNEIPTLREYFELVKPTNIVTNIELKTGINQYPGIEQAVADMIKEFGLEDRIIISSFNYYSVLRFKEIMPDMPCGFLEESWLLDFCAYTKKYGIEYIHPEYHMITEEFARESRESGVGLNTWTVNTREAMEDLARKGVRSIITNYPDLCKEVLAEMAESEQ